MLQKQLKEVFGVSFTEVVDITSLRQFHHANAYCVDEAGALLGLCATEIQLDALEVPDYPVLVYLNLSENKHLREVRFKAALAQLMHLDLSDSGVVSLKMQAGFEQLAWLDVARNALQQLVLQGTFTKLKYLDLSNNQLTDFSAHQLTLFPALEHIFLQKNQLPSAKQAATNERGSCLAFMQRFLRELGKGITENKEYKVLLVGNGGVGKSCLVERLVYNSFDQRHLSTHGVALEQYVNEEQGYPFVLNLWDFGGQDIYHATHRLFMEANAVYLALWDEESRQQPTSIIPEAGEDREYQNFPLDYWLHYIRQLGGNSPVIVVKTKSKDNNAMHPQQPELHQRYQVYEYRQVDSKLDDPGANGTRPLLGTIQEAILSQLGVEKELPQNWADLRQHLRSLQQAGSKVLSLEEYQDIAEDYNVEAPTEVLMKWLVPAGVVFYRQGYFGDVIILQQGWAIEAIYTVFERNTGLYYRLRDTQNGSFSGADLQQVWKNKAYSRAEQELLVNFMLSCELCFEVTPPVEEKHTSVPFVQRQFVAPQLLPVKIPTSAEMMKGKGGLLYVRYRHDFLHYGIIQSFIVRAQQLADTRDIWQQGIVLKEDGRYAMVAVVPATQRGAHAFDIEVICERESLSLLDKVRNTLEDLQDGNIGQWVSVDGEQFVDLARLQNWKEDRIPAEENKGLVSSASLQVFLQQRQQEKLSLPQTASKKDAERMIQMMEKEQLQRRDIPEIEIPSLVLEESSRCILFVQANPTAQEISWKDEYVAIKQKIDKVNGQHDFSLRDCDNADLDDLQDAIEDHTPGILHFCGHGQEEKIGREGAVTQMGGLVLHNENKNGSEVLDTAAIGRLFREIKADQPQLRIVFLNACHSREQAAAISEAGLFTIGTTQEIVSIAARKFASGFYRGLVQGTDVLTAIQRGVKRAIVIDKDIPKLIEAYYGGNRIYPQ